MAYNEKKIECSSTLSQCNRANKREKKRKKRERATHVVERPRQRQRQQRRQNLWKWNGEANLFDGIFNPSHWCPCRCCWCSQLVYFSFVCSFFLRSVDSCVRSMSCVDCQPSTLICALKLTPTYRATGSETSKEWKSSTKKTIFENRAKKTAPTTTTTFGCFFFLFLNLTTTNELNLQLLAMPFAFDYQWLWW